MNKKDLHQKILEKMSSQGIDTSNIDQEKCGVINNYYHVLNKRGDLLFRFNLDKLNKSRANSNPKTKSNFLLGCGIVLAIPGFLFLFTVLIPIFTVAISSFNSVSEKAKVSAVKNALTNGIKECVILSSEGGDTSAQANVQSFPGNYTGYTIGVWTAGARDNTCYNAQATPDDDAEATFWIEMDTDGNVTKGCDSAAKKGCDTGAIW